MSAHRSSHVKLDFEVAILDTVKPNGQPQSARSGMVEDWTTFFSVMGALSAVTIDLPVCKVGLLCCCAKINSVEDTFSGLVLCQLFRKGSEMKLINKRRHLCVYSSTL